MLLYDIWIMNLEPFVFPAFFFCSFPNVAQPVKRVGHMVHMNENAGAVSGLLVHYSSF
jgi:hypothetical protein